MKNREWLRRAGPFEISEGTLRQAREEADFWHQAAAASQEEVIGLRQELRQSDKLFADLE